VLLSELDSAGHTDALEILLLLSSDAIAADVELHQPPHILDGIGNSDNPPWLEVLTLRRFFGMVFAIWVSVTFSVSGFQDPTSFGD
jgi:hypothetical protein